MARKLVKKVTKALKLVGRHVNRTIVMYGMTNVAAPDLAQPDTIYSGEARYHRYENNINQGRIHFHDGESTDDLLRHFPSTEAFRANDQDQNHISSIITTPDNEVRSFGSPSTSWGASNSQLSNESMLEASYYSSQSALKGHESDSIDDDNFGNDQVIKMVVGPYSDTVQEHHDTSNSTNTPITPTYDDKSSIAPSSVSESSTSSTEGGLISTALERSYRRQLNILKKVMFDTIDELEQEKVKAEKLTEEKRVLKLKAVALNAQLDEALCEGRRAQEKLEGIEAENDTRDDAFIAALKEIQEQDDIIIDLKARLIPNALLKAELEAANNRIEVLEYHSSVWKDDLETSLNDYESYSSINTTSTRRTSVIPDPLKPVLKKPLEFAADEDSELDPISPKNSPQRSSSPLNDFQPESQSLNDSPTPPRILRRKDSQPCLLLNKSLATDTTTPTEMKPTLISEKSTTPPPLKKKARRATFTVFTDNDHPPFSTTTSNTTLPTKPHRLSLAPLDTNTNTNTTLHLQNLTSIPPSSPLQSAYLSELAEPTKEFSHMCKHSSWQKIPGRNADKENIAIGRPGERLHTGRKQQTRRNRLRKRNGKGGLLGISEDEAKDSVNPTTTTATTTTMTARLSPKAVRFAEWDEVWES
ncbi:MAG: hypothetical protein M1834_008006 [Cirrosporium novae-zelandiae]|nr:MAG: hypothetical protein M1834_008006 [Cirrosporium novae-zelandiae]